MDIDLKRESSEYWNTAVVAVVVLVTILVAWFAGGREFINVNTETDFIGGFQLEAARFLAGKRMEIEFHPPGYSIAIAMMHEVSANWFKAALLISVIASAAILVFNYLCFRELVSPAAGFGAVAALIGAPIFFSFSIQSTSDIFFLALYSIALYTLVYAMRSRKLVFWLLTGIAISLVFLSRTNGIIFILALGAPLLVYDAKRDAVKAVAALIFGFSILVIVWWVYAQHTNSPFMPTKTYANLALTYAGGADRITGDARIPLESQFSSSMDVLLSDPAHVALTYARDLMALPRNLLTTLLSMPLAIGYALCSLGWLLKLGDRRVLVVLVITLSGVALTNMKAFEPRYYMFLLPVVGASLGLIVSDVSRLAPHFLRSQKLQSSAFALFALLSFAVYGEHGFSLAEERQISLQLKEIVPALSKLTPVDSVLMCRKSNAAFHAGRKDVVFPPMASREQLRIYLEGIDRVEEVGGVRGRVPIFILVARAEQAMRPEMSKSLLSEPLPAWLEITEEGFAGGHWRLIRYRPELG